MKISLVTTCKSRLPHLKQTFESWKHFRPIEIIVVDVSCPDRTKEWLAVFHGSFQQTALRALGLDVLLQSCLGQFLV